ncbi:uncharacterized protein LOC123723228 isoform X3 [Papilio machaon]|uniref:uncharacterized protein LOC123723228 isoform X3 n=1 Tax=Papilio machaon TaxID=76193 RepID=UPI001E664749|nr:uncharacterized protein LOC123723228 isoform X3 [Papilio machaon]
MVHSFPLHVQYVAKSDTRKDVLNDHNYCSRIAVIALHSTRHSSRRCGSVKARLSAPSAWSSLTTCRCGSSAPRTTTATPLPPSQPQDGT